jgi:hypothetical protein
LYSGFLLVADNEGRKMREGLRGVQMIIENLGTTNIYYNRSAEFLSWAFRGFEGGHEPFTTTVASNDV